MAVRGWGGSIATAIGVAAAAGAAQLGFGYGLGIIAWLPSPNGSTEPTWVAGLTWATWIAATSVIAGAVLAGRHRGPVRHGPVGTIELVLWRITLCLAAALGAAVTVALIAVPARAAAQDDTFSPETIAAGYAVVGVIVGLIVSFGAISSPSVAANVVTTGSWLWLLAVIAVIDGAVTGDGLASAQLGVWRITGDGDGYWIRSLYWPGAAISLLSALVAGLISAWYGIRRVDAKVGVAVSGAIGPILVAASYFLAAPRPVGIESWQVSAYLVAPYAVIAGLLGSVIIVAATPRAAADQPAPVTAQPAAEPAAHSVPQPAPRPAAIDTPKQAEAEPVTAEIPQQPAAPGLHPPRAVGSATPPKPSPDA